MFSPETYAERRRTLITSDAPASGLVLLLGNRQSAMNAAANPYPFRQDSSFLYYTGLDVPGLDAAIDLDDGTTCLYGADPSMDDIIWTGPLPTRSEYAEQAGIADTAAPSALAEDLTTALEHDRPVHVLPPYRERHYQRLSTLLGLQRDHVDAHVSVALVDAVIAQRALKSDAEIQELEQAVATTAEMHEAAFTMATPGTSEQAIVGRMTGIAEARGQGLSFPPICSIHGEVLHNHEYAHTLDDGDLLLVDAGGTSPLHYAGDLTRVAPVGGAFSSRQRAVYEAVLDAQEQAIAAVEPGVAFRDVHRRACIVLAEHLIDLGLMTGPAANAVDVGAHALFFPHGLGHMLGLDVHDMEALGEDRVGYADNQERSEQFGLHALRLARPLQAGFVLTVEPGCYFIPALIRQWREDNRYADLINYDAIADFEDVRGIRIEDDVVVTETGARVLGPDLPKQPEAVEARIGA